MIKEIIKELEKIDNLRKTKFLKSRENTFIIYLIYLKYLIDNKVYNYEEVILDDNLYEITHEIEFLNTFYLKKEHLPINKILIKIKDISTKDLLLEFLSYIEHPITFHEENDNIIFINLRRYFINYYNPKGNTTYLINMMNSKDIELLKLFDTILGIKNNYIKGEDITLNNYDYIYIYDDIPKSRLRVNNVFEKIRILLRNNKNIVLMTNYNKISNFQEGRFISHYLKTIIINDTKATILLNESNINKDISIINYDKEKISSLEKLQSIIKNNKKQKDILVKVSHNDLVENNLRIGFNLYQLEKECIIKDINKIVDENTKFLKRLNDINEIVEREINKLLNK